MYGERVIENAAAVASESPEQRASAPPTSTENILTKPAGAHPDGKVPKLSGEAQGFLDEANGASDPASNAWFAFLALLTYLLVTLAGVSHKALLLDSPVALPIVVNIDIPLRSFFQYAPALLLLVYLSLLIQHLILARKYRKFKEAIAPYERETRTEHPARERVHSYVFSQILVGPKPDRITKFVMQLIVYVTFTILPLITLLYFQIKFLPYHEVWITYWHRFAVILGLLMLIFLTPLFIKVGPQAEAWEVSRTEKVLGVCLLIASLCFSWLIATVPNEWIDQRLGFVAPMSVYPVKDEPKLLNPLVRFLCERTPEAVGWLSPCRVFPLRWLSSYRVLDVEDRDLVPDEGDEQNEVSVALRDRDFRFALLSRSDLHRADLTNADLRAAQMWRTRVDKAKLRGAQLQGAFLKGAQLQGADLEGAQLQGADLEGAQLQGAILSYARFQGADLKGAQLQGADLKGAQLQGAHLKDAQLQGARLFDPERQRLGLNPDTAQLQRADLASADVWLVNFPPDLDDQSPAPLGLADLKTTLTGDAKAKLKQDLEASIADSKVLSLVISRLDRIAEAPWEDGTKWKKFSEAKNPSANELAQSHALLACADTEGYIANSMAGRAKEFETEDFREGYAKAFARALLNENCKGGKVLTDETRAALEDLVSARPHSH